MGKKNFLSQNECFQNFLKCLKENENKENISLYEHFKNYSTVFDEIDTYGKTPKQEFEKEQINFENKFKNSELYNFRKITIDNQSFNTMINDDNNKNFQYFYTYLLLDTNNVSLGFRFSNSPNLNNDFTINNPVYYLKNSICMNTDINNLKNLSDAFVEKFNNDFENQTGKKITRQIRDYIYDVRSINLTSKTDIEMLLNSSENLLLGFVFDNNGVKDYRNRGVWYP